MVTPCHVTKRRLYWDSRSGGASHGLAVACESRHKAVGRAVRVGPGEAPGPGGPLTSVGGDETGLLYAVISTLPYNQCCDVTHTLTHEKFNGAERGYLSKTGGAEFSSPI